MYTVEKNAQIVLSLLKEHGIRYVVASPGSTNISIVKSMQNDPFFVMYSVVDERSAAYLACGIAEETGEPVVISCTGATASRNYLPGLTEAFYRKLPVLAITSTQAISKVGHGIAQVIDRSLIPNDVAQVSVTLPIVKDEDDFWDCEIKVNKALLALKHHGGGPVHINIPTTYIRSFQIKELPEVRIIKRITVSDLFPVLPEGKIVVFIGSHAKMSNELTQLIDNFCASNNAVVFCDHTSNYKGKYRLLYSLVTCQKMYDLAGNPDLMIYIGEISGDYYNMRAAGKQVWKINEDGKICDTFRKLKYVFEMPDKLFFENYVKKEFKNNDSYYKECIDQILKIRNKIPELPFSNIWIASKLSHLIPENSTIHFSILNSLRSWNFFELPESVHSTSNVGGFGIDGGVSTLVGASLTNKNKLFFGVIGDLAFFYDMNAIGNRHISSNLRIMLINNGKGTEFRLGVHEAFQYDDDADEFISAARHYGNKSVTLVKNFSQDLGFEYVSARDKSEFENVYSKFIDNQISEKPILFEVFTNSEDENEALETIINLEVNNKVKSKQIAKQILGENSINLLKKIIK